MYFLKTVKNRKITEKDHKFTRKTVGKQGHPVILQTISGALAARFLFSFICKITEQCNLFTRKMRRQFNIDPYIL